jgi:hypothetical protein
MTTTTAATPLTYDGMRRLRNTVALAVFAAVLLTAVAAGTLADRTLRRQLGEHSGNLLRQMAVSMRDTLDREMEQHYEQVRLLSGMDELNEDMKPEKVRRLLDQMKESFPQFAWMGLTDGQGKVLASTGGLLQGNNVSARPWFKGALDGPFVGDVHPAVLLEKLLPRQQEPWRFVDVAIPILDSAGKARNVLGAHLSWSWARNIRRSLTPSGAGGGEIQILVVAKDGSIILGPAGQEGQKIDLAPFRVSAAGAPGFAIKDAQITAYAETRGSGRYPGLGWTVLVRQPAQAAAVTVAGLREQIGLGALLLAVLFATCTWFGMRAALRPKG